MASWVSGMPEGMFLKSHGFASNLYEPTASFTLERYCAENGLSYSAENLPVPLSTFISYGLAFQRLFVPDLEDRVVCNISESGSGYEIVFDDGEVLAARRVIIASGIKEFHHVPPVLDEMPSEFVTHSSTHSSLAPFDGKSVAVIGAGSSALDFAVLLHQRGIEVELFCRRSEVEILSRTFYPRPIRSQIRRPQSPMGPGWRSRLSADGARFYRYLPTSFRMNFLRTHLGPSGGWFLRDEIEHIPVHTSSTIRCASISGNKVLLDIVDAQGAEREFRFDHVVAATGYKVDLQRLPFLSNELRSQIVCLNGYPVVSSHFESSLSRLYFAGQTTATTFGPVVRFACGARLTSERISEHLNTRRSRPERRLARNGPGPRTNSPEPARR